MAQGRDVQRSLALGGSSQGEAALVEEQISVPLSQIIPWLADAAANGVSWLHDFEEEDIAISADLYDVILAYQHFHQR